jgi:hypothetical protein
MCSCDLPAKGADWPVLLPPVARLWVRFCSQANLWIYFSFDDDHVLAIRVTRGKPLFVDESDC